MTSASTADDCHSGQAHGDAQRKRSCAVCVACSVPGSPDASCIASVAQVLYRVRALPASDDAVPFLTGGIERPPRGLFV
ncbi:hypothetical protein [Caballeronia pedi]|nr:hypothetical protein [Caballeronia pedi]